MCALGVLINIGWCKTISNLFPSNSIQQLNFFVIFNSAMGQKGTNSDVSLNYLGNVYILCNNVLKQLSIFGWNNYHKYIHNQTVGFVLFDQTLAWTFLNRGGDRVAKVTKTRQIRILVYFSHICSFWHYSYALFSNFMDAINVLIWFPKCMEDFHVQV